MSYKILFVITQPFDPETGGVQMTTFKLSKYFQDAGNEVKVFSFRHDCHANYEPIQLLPANFVNGYHNVENQKQLSAEIRLFRPDVVINQMPYEQKIGEILHEAKKQYKYLLIGCLRNSLYSVRLNIDDYIGNFIPSPLRIFFQNPLGRMVFQHLHKHKHASQLRNFLDTYDRYIMFAEPNYEEMRYFIGNYKNEKLSLIPNSIPDTFSKVPDKEKVLLYLGRLSVAQKRADLLLPLWKQIKDELPDWNFLVVGDGDYKAVMEQQVQDEGIERVTLFGRMPSFPFYEKAPVLIMTSAFEGFPNVIVEAQSRACAPVIMNSYPVASWLVDDGVNGLLVQPFDLDEMAKKIVETVHSEEKMNQLCEGALKNAEQFVIDRVGQQWIELFNENLKGQTSTGSSL